MKQLLVLAILFSGLSSFIFGQDSTETTSQEQVSGFSFNLGMEAVSRYVWRGVECGVENNSSTPHFQPGASLNYNFNEASGISLGFWGSYGFNGSFSENDIYLTYLQSTSAGNFSVTFTDYYFPSAEVAFTDFENHGLGAHTIDGQLSYTFPKAFPLTLMVSTNLHNDVPGFKSFYAEASYPFSISDVELNIFAGAAQGPSLWHGVTTDKMEFVNTGFKASKSIKITQDFSLPVGLSWIFNPHLKKTYLVFKLTF